MNKDELLKRLSEIEWEDFEVKEAHNKLPNNVWETVSAFCNTAGGWIVLGIRQIGKDFEIQGVENGEKVESDFLNTLRSGQKLNYPIYPIAKKYQFGEKTVLAFFIASSPNKPVYFGTTNNTFIRFGSGDRRATDFSGKNRGKITINGVHYHIEKLKKDNIIERNGGRKYGYWEILQP